MLWDSHCHLAAWEDDEALEEAVFRARVAGVSAMLAIASGPQDWEKTAERARKFRWPYVVGIHPRFGSMHNFYDLCDFVKSVDDDPYFAGIGEIGLDHTDGHAEDELYWAQLELAQRHRQCVVLHCYKTAGRLLYGLKHYGKGLRGIVHAFNGGEVERASFRERGFVLGFGPTITYKGSVRVRAHLANVDPQGWVLETDAPYMLTATRRMGGYATGDTADIKEVLHVAARLRGLTEAEAANESSDNLLRVLGYGLRRIPH